MRALSSLRKSYRSVAALLITSRAYFFVPPRDLAKVSKPTAKTMMAANDDLLVVGGHVHDDEAVDQHADQQAHQ